MRNWHAKEYSKSCSGDLNFERCPDCDKNWSEIVRDNYLRRKGSDQIRNQNSQLKMCATVKCIRMLLLLILIKISIPSVFLSFRPVWCGAALRVFVAVYYFTSISCFHSNQTAVYFRSVFLLSSETSCSDLPSDFSTFQSCFNTRENWLLAGERGWDEKQRDGREGKVRLDWQICHNRLFTLWCATPGHPATSKQTNPATQCNNSLIAKQAHPGPNYNYIYS